MELALKTWTCSNYPDCPFSWQFSGEAVNTTPYDLTPSQLQRQFSERQYIGLEAGHCPNCYINGTSGVLGLAIDVNRMSRSNVASDAELEAQQTQDLDPNGNPIMVESGQVRERLGIVDGKPAVITEPVYEPKTRELTTKELSALKLQRDQSLDSLEAIAVKELSEEPTPTLEEPISWA